MILYLVLTDLLDFPILYLSGYINKHKSDYYRLLQEIRTKNAWEEYVIYMLNGVEQQSKHTTEQLVDIDMLVKSTKQHVQDIKGIKYSDTFVMGLFDNPSFTLTQLESTT